MRISCMGAMCHVEPQALTPADSLYGRGCIAQAAARRQTPEKSPKSSGVHPFSRAFNGTGCWLASISIGTCHSQTACYSVLALTLPSKTSPEQIVGMAFIDIHVHLVPNAGVSSTEAASLTLLCKSLWPLRFFYVTLSVSSCAH